MVVIRARRSMVAILIEGDERADSLRIHDALGHPTIIPNADGRPPS
jgi:hypothetical protein